MIIFYYQMTHIYYYIKHIIIIIFFLNIRHTLYFIHICTITIFNLQLIYFNSRG